MDKHKIVPDIIDVAPKEKLEVKYGNNTVDMGNTLTPTQVKKPPTVSWKFQPGTYYTLCMTDPDAPSRKDPKFREWHHWLVGNIEENNIGKGEVLSDYIPSAPPKGSGLHRYVFLLYEQSGKIDFKEKKLTNKSGDGRGKFSIKKFAEKYKLGDPIAGNLYQAEWDNYVPEVYKQLSY